MLRSPFGSPWSACLLLVWSGIAALATTPADGQLIWPGSRVATIETEHLRVHVPIEHVESLTPLAARAETIYAHMIADAGYVPRDRLDVLFGDWVDSHNGYSFVTPFPVVQVELAPATPLAALGRS